jgi:hypothetical protein
VLSNLGNEGDPIEAADLIRDRFPGLKLGDGKGTSQQLQFDLLLGALLLQVLGEGQPTLVFNVVVAMAMEGGAALGVVPQLCILADPDFKLGIATLDVRFEVK